MWALIRAILGSWRIPEQSPYAREIMTWRLYELLASDRVLNDDAFAEPNRYWQHQSKRQQTLRRFELAEQLADLFEQYLMYRPDWIERWDQGDEAHWQAQLWRLLTEAEPDHPVRLLRDAESRIARPEEPPAGTALHLRHQQPGSLVAGFHQGAVGTWRRGFPHLLPQPQ